MDCREKSISGILSFPFPSRCGIPTLITTSKPNTFATTAFSTVPKTCDKRPAYVSRSSFLLKNSGLEMNERFGRDSR